MHRSIKLASISFLAITILLGAHQYRLKSHKHDMQMMSQAEVQQSAKQGAPTFFETNPFGMPAAPLHPSHRHSRHSHAAAYGLTPPTARQDAPGHGPGAWAHEHANSGGPSGAVTMQAAAETKAPSRPWYSYLGLLGLLGLIGLGRRSGAPHAE